MAASDRYSEIGPRLQEATLSPGPSTGNEDERSDIVRSMSGMAFLVTSSSMVGGADLVKLTGRFEQVEEKAQH